MSQNTSPDETYCALHAATGGRLFTVTVLDRAANLARRVYTSHPESYPVSGTKPMQQNAWTRQVIDRGGVFVANTVDGFSEYFADFALIQSLGCEAALNIPIATDQVIGTVNILDRAHYFDDETVAKCVSEVERRHQMLVQAFASASL